MEAKDQPCRDREGAVADAAPAVEPAIGSDPSRANEPCLDREGAEAESDGQTADDRITYGNDEPTPDEPCRDREGAEANDVDAPTESAEPEPGEPALTPEQPALPPEDDPELRAVIEAIVYVTEEPVTPAQIAAVVKRPEATVRKVLESLAAECAVPERGITIREIAGGYKMATKPEHHEILRAFAKSLKPPLKLSLAALETLATIAYKQPITAPEIMEIRGVQGAGVLKTLLDRKLIQTAGRKNVVGKPILYRTSREFLVQFGLKDVAELPTLKEFEELRRIAVAEPESESEAAFYSARREQTVTSNEQSELLIDPEATEQEPQSATAEQTGPAPDAETAGDEQAGAAPDAEASADQPPGPATDVYNADTTSDEPPATARGQSEPSEATGHEPATIREQSEQQAGPTPGGEAGAETTRGRQAGPASQATGHESRATGREQAEPAGSASGLGSANDEPEAVSGAEASETAREATTYEPDTTSSEQSEQDEPDAGTPAEDRGERRSDESPEG
ncbi:MAG TPA: SMC-Scp complex subunit ScpB [Bryobacteraceae bacterium]|nr:SMC-Scp complex subunit ScpB [Bryobacteraceae bacterium]